MNSSKYKLTMRHYGDADDPAVLLSETALREALMLASCNNLDRVDSIILHIQQKGQCELTGLHGSTTFVIEKILQS